MIDLRHSNTEFVGVSSSADECAPAADAHDLQPRAAGATIPEAGPCGFDWETL
jgi:hypothetical protein